MALFDGLRGTWQPEEDNVFLSVTLEYFRPLFGDRKCCAEYDTCTNPAVIWAIVDTPISNPGPVGGYMCEEHWNHDNKNKLLNHIYKMYTANDLQHHHEAALLASMLISMS